MKTSLKKNFFYNLFYKIVTLVTPLITAPYVSRVLKPSGVGEYSYTFSIAHLFLIFAALGVAEYGSRSIARVKDDAKEKNIVFSEILTMQLALSVLLLCFYIAYSFLFAEAYVLALIQGMNLLAAMFDITWFLFGMELFVVTTVRNVIVKLIGVIMILFLVKTQDDVWLYAAIMAGSTLLGQLSVWPLLHKYVRFVKPSFSGVLKHLKPNIILFLPVIASNLLGYFDKVMIGAMAGKKQLGWYENADKMITIPNSIVTALGAVMLPRVTNSLANGKTKEVKQLTEKSMLFLAFATSAMGFGISAVAKEFTPVFFGEGYDPVVQLIYIMAPYMVFVSWANIMKTQCLLPHNKDKVYVRCLLIGSAINVVLNYFLIQLWGAIGAAVATTFSWGLISFLETFALRRLIDYKRYLFNAVPFFATGLFMALCIWFIDTGSDIVTLLVKMVVGGVIYLSVSIFIVYKLHNDVFRMLLKKKTRK